MSKPAVYTILVRVNFERWVSVRAESREDAKLIAEGETLSAIAKGQLAPDKQKSDLISIWPDGEHKFDFNFEDYRDEEGTVVVER